VLEEMAFGVLAVSLFNFLKFRVLKVVMTTNLGVNLLFIVWKYYGSGKIVAYKRIYLEK
jgi:hypothetical protein